MVTYWGATSIANMRTVPYKQVQESILASTVFINVYATCTSTDSRCDPSAYFCASCHYNSNLEEK